MFPLSTSDGFIPLNEDAKRELHISRIIRIGLFFITPIFVFIFILFTLNVTFLNPQLNENEIKEQKYQVLLEWMLKSGARIDGVEAKSMFAGGGRGLYATKDIYVKENAFSIPAILWISDRNAKKRSAISYLYLKDKIVQKYIDKNGDGWGLILMLEKIT
eukprot:c8644_g1_i1.p1 GENE.c8644_g1_i1~~c8644_g1_i1.p1  ORF type:complete len:160 (+),score=55.52 c8644_g1_i1:63-542(+)